MKPARQLLVICLILGGLAAGVWWFNRPVPARPVADPPQPPVRSPVPVESTPKPPIVPALSGNSPIHFSQVPDNGGITFQHVTGTSAEKPFPAANGSGIAALDFDRDGYQDLCFGTGTPFPVDLTRRSPHNQMYRNRGAWRFQDVTAQTGLGHNGYTAGLAVGDIDNDGFPDLFLSCYGPDVLYRNLGDGTFERVVSGVEDPRWGTSAAFLDFDNDGNLDLYVCNYGDWTPETNKYCGNREQNVRIHCSPHTLNPVRDSLFRNLGDGRFADVTDAVGVGGRLARSQGVIVADFNQDGLTDLYMGNDLHANSLFMNAGRGRFNDATELSGTGYDERGRMQAGMGVDVADVTGDGQFDLFVTNFEGETNTLYENQQDGVYRPVTQERGLAADSLAWVGWGCAARDFDLDGFEDIWVVNGHVDDNLQLLGKDSPYLHPSCIWHNERGRFRFLGAAVGDYFTRPHPARALVVADLDNDGDWDGVIGHQDGIPALLRNDHQTKTPGGRASLQLELIGTRGSRDATGATVILRRGNQEHRQPVRNGGSYLSAPSTRLVFSPSEQLTQLEIIWPAGRRSELSLPSSAGSYQIIEPKPNEKSGVWRMDAPD